MSPRHAFRSNCLPNSQGLVRPYHPSPDTDARKSGNSFMFTSLLAAVPWVVLVVVEFAR